jgi:hypothetical protein
VHVPPKLDYPLFDKALRRAEQWHADPDELLTLLTQPGFAVDRDAVEIAHTIPRPLLLSDGREPRHVGALVLQHGGNRVHGMDSPTAVAILGVFVLGAWLWRRRTSGASRQEEARLRRICFGGDGQVERLIRGEMTRTPGISRAEAASRAVQRYQRDNR